MGVKLFVVVGNSFSECKGVACSEENLFLTLLFFAGLLTSFVTFAILVHILEASFLLLFTLAGLIRVFVSFVFVFLF
jgi:hypothetical protein